MTISRLSRKVRLEVLPNRNVQVWSGGELLREFDISVRPALGLTLLARINALKDENGNPIYANYRWEGYYLWALHQEELLNRYCIQYAHHKDLLNYLDENGLEVDSCSDTEISSLAEIVELLGLGKSSQVSKRTVPAAIRQVGQGVFWLIITAAALMKTRVKRIRVGLFSYDFIWSGHTFDRRLKDIYYHLFTARIPFIELFAGFGKEAIRNLSVRKRISIYFPPVRLKIRSEAMFKYDYSVFEDLDRRLVARVVPIAEAWTRRDQKVAPRLARLLKISGLKKIYSIDDCWNTAPLILACRKLDLELIALAHAYFMQYHQGMLQTFIPSEYTCGFPKVIVWGDVFKSFLLKHGNCFKPDQLIPAGHIRPLQLKPRRKCPRGDRPFTILYPYEFLADFKEISSYLRAFIDKGYRIFFKSRWDSSVNEQLSEFPRDHLTIIDEVDQNLLEQIDVCAGTQSSVLYDMYALGIPMWYLETGADYLSHIVEFGLGARIRLEDVKRADFNPQLLLKEPVAGVFGSQSVSDFIKN